MDPITAMILGALVLTACAKVGIAATSDAITTARASKAGEWDWLSQDRERRAAARKAWLDAWAARRSARHKAAGGDGEFRPGAREYAADLYHGFWESRLERRTAKRAARGPYVYDPDRPPWHRRFDDALLSKVERLRERWGQYRADRQPVEDTPLDELLGHEPPTFAPQPVTHEPGTWTIDDRGGRVELAPTEPDDTGDEDEDAEHQGAVDAVHGTHTETTGGTMTTPAAVATEVNNNEDVRQALAVLKQLSERGQEATAVLENIKMRMGAIVNALIDGMATKQYDRDAVTAAAEAADAINLGDIAILHGLFETVLASSSNAAAALEKYRDAEDVVASNNVDASTLDSASA